MPTSKYKLYSFLLASCTIGYFWIFYTFSLQKQQISSFTPCLIKNISHLPCPSCGSTRAILFLLKGKFIESLYTNPLGLLIMIVLIISPLWIIIDIVYKKNSLLRTFCWIESQVIKKNIALFLILLVLLNWIWSVSKNL
ncbi:DUF2752 domain-containing protein [Bernardetia sp.]|uniref:DUF2752 domain-containing protein n=1 Tax=Bernardetia sp. TaxID=1937974 RepID=UPI00345908C2